MHTMKSAEDIVTRIEAMMGKARTLRFLEGRGDEESPRAKFLRDDIAALAHTLAEGLRHERKKSTS